MMVSVPGAFHAGWLAAYLSCMAREGLSEETLSFRRELIQGTVFLGDKSTGARALRRD